MRLTRKRARKLTEALESERERIHTDPDRSYDEIDGVPRTSLWERERKDVLARLRKLPTMVEEAADAVAIERGRGRPPSLEPDQKTLLFLFALLTQRSNRDMEALLMLLGPVFELSTSYKTIERLYSDDEDELVLYNLMVLILENRGVSGHTAGDGTGYSLHAGGHYRADPDKTDAAYRYVFRLVDLETGMYVGYGYSDTSEKAAFRKAIRFVEREQFPVDSIRLDKYYSSRKNLRELGQDVEAFVIPKDNLASFGTEWREVFERIAEDPTEYLEEYYKRELTESYFAADKDRFGREIHQIREDRREMTAMGLTVLHNLFSVRVTSD